MDFYRLGKTAWLDTALLCHALPRMERSGLLLLTPASPYLCVGLHQDVERVIDMGLCEKEALPIFRREMGGGLAYLDEGQVLFQVVLPQQHPVLRGDWPARYRALLEPVLQVCRALGVAAEFAPLNRITVGGRDLAQIWAAETGEFYMFAGYLTLNFDPARLTRLIITTQTGACDRLQYDGQLRLTGLTALLTPPPSLEQLYAHLEERFAALLGPLTPRAVDAPLQAQAAALQSRMLSRMWLLSKGQASFLLRAMRVRTGIRRREHGIETPGGLICAVVELDEDYNRLVSVTFSGDFFVYPAEGSQWLEMALENTSVYGIEKAIAQVYAALPIETPGIQAEHWSQAVNVGL